MALESYFGVHLLGENHFLSQVSKSGLTLFVNDSMLWNKVH